MKIEITAGDVQKVAGNGLTKKPAAEKFLKKNNRQLVAAIMEAAQEILEDWVFDEEIDHDPVSDEEDEEDDDDYEDD